MTTEREKNSSEKNERGGGLKSAAPFWFGLLGLAAASLCVSWLMLASRDTLIELVPENAIAYLHVQGRRNQNLIRAMNTNVPATNVYESAIFVMPGEDARWTTLLRWSSLLPPSATERTELKRIGAVELDQLTFVMGTAFMAEDLSSSLENDAETSSALETSRSVSRVQFYVDAPNLLGNKLAEILPFNDAVLAKQVGWVTNTRTSAPIMFMSNVSSLSSANGPLGYAAETRTANYSAPLPLMGAENEQPYVSYSLNGSRLDPTELLLEGVDRRRAESGVPDNEELVNAKNNINAVFSGHLSALFFGDQTSEPSYAFYLPDTNLADFENLIVRYVNASLPRKDKFELPDGRIVEEYIIEPQFDVMLNVSGDSNDSAQKTETDELLPFTVASYIEGVIVAKDQKILEIMLTSLKNTESDCLITSNEAIHISNIATLSNQIPSISKVLSAFGFTHIFIHKIGDKQLIFCG